MSADTDIMTGALSQLAKSVGTSIGVAACLWIRPDIAWVLVLGWCATGLWLAVRHYRSAVKVVAHAAGRRAEIVVTEIAPQRTERERCVAILQHFLQPVPDVPDKADTASAMIDAFALRCGNTAIEAAIRAVREDPC